MPEEEAETGDRGPSRGFGYMDPYIEKDEEFEIFVERFECWLRVKKIAAPDQNDAFLNAIGKKSYVVLRRATYPVLPHNRTLPQNIASLKTHLSKSPIKDIEKFALTGRFRKDNETVSDYADALR